MRERVYPNAADYCPKNKQVFFFIYFSPQIISLLPYFYVNFILTLTKLLKKLINSNLKFSTPMIQTKV